ncbi:D-amino-acid oxidase [Pluteus cervinus]|uniref:D-amino-acid oxidase n=1 Tax=Pluteus cervinus TaxID=181527 RepID=A0ACD3ANN9_9AGAR|nr:D-amino-acid oxidase [Pluteus cervinus]
MAEERKLHEVVVIGAGVIGLTTAVKLQETGNYKVTIVAETFPTDPKTIKYTSHWAGAHHVSGGSGLQSETQLRLEQRTFEDMWPMSAPGQPTEGCFLRLSQSEYYGSENSVPYHLEGFMPNFKVLPPKELPTAAVYGLSFDTITIDVPVYLNYLLSRFLGRGGSIVRGSIQHISQIVENGARAFTQLPAYPRVDDRQQQQRRPDAIIVCAGIGARFLGGVEDKSVYPLRGQTVLLRSPWVRFGRTLCGSDGVWTYVIPRRSGDVIVGGTRIANDWFPTPRPEITKDILTRVIGLAPELAPPEVRAHRQPTADDLIPLIIEEGCGLRPAREDGIRLEVEWYTLGENKVPVVHNYGHSGTGYQSSWGSASDAFLLLEGALADGPPN